MPAPSNAEIDAALTIVRNAGYRTFYPRIGRPDKTTKKQLKLALDLITELGYGVGLLDAQHMVLGAPDDACTGDHTFTVDAWVGGKTKGEASAFIHLLMRLRDGRRAVKEAALRDPSWPRNRDVAAAEPGAWP